MKTEGGFLISKIKQIQGRVFDELMKKEGIEDLNGAQGRILYVLWQRKELPITQLAKETGLAKTTMTSMLKRLEETGFILRESDRDDHRSTVVKLTDKSIKMNEAYQQVSDKMSELFYEGFSENEILDFESKLIRILNNLEKQNHGENKERNSPTD